MDECYSAYHIDNDLLKFSSSGGVATALAERILEKNGVVYGVAFTDDFCGAKYVKISNRKELKKIRGSKYIKADAKLDNGKSVYQDVKEALEKNDVLFFGLPCEVAALRQFVKDLPNTEYSLVTVDLICQGPTFREVQEQFVKQLERKNNARITDMSFRYKKESWGKYCYVAFDNGETYIEPLGSTGFWKMFGVLKSEACFNCKFKGENRKSDITLGDYWGIPQDSDYYNPLGNSVVVVHSDKGKTVLEENPYLKITPVDKKQALAKNPMYFESVKRHRDYLRFYNMFNKKGLEYAAKHGVSLFTKMRILKSKIRRIIIK